MVYSRYIKQTVNSKECTGRHEKTWNNDPVTVLTAKMAVETMLATNPKLSLHFWPFSHCSRCPSVHPQNSGLRRASMLGNTEAGISTREYHLMQPFRHWGSIQGVDKSSSARVVPLAMRRGWNDSTASAEIDVARRVKPWAVVLNRCKNVSSEQHRHTHALKFAINRLPSGSSARNDHQDRPKGNTDSANPIILGSELSAARSLSIEMWLKYNHHNQLKKNF